jgi:hypothetical protein
MVIRIDLNNNKKAGSRLQISMNVMCCPQMVHLFSLVIYTNGLPLIDDKKNVIFVDVGVEYVISLTLPEMSYE